jgi:nucleoside-diphosphate-sugar epimerase
MLLLAERGPGGPVNATGPATPLTIRETLERIGPGADLRWVDDQTVLDAGVDPWMELPLWLPGDEMAHLMDVDIARALAAGLTFRPLEETARDTLEWSKVAGEQRETLSRAKERAILDTVV